MGFQGTVGDSQEARDRLLKQAGSSSSAVAKMRGCSPGEVPWVLAEQGQACSLQRPTSVFVCWTPSPRTTLGREEGHLPQVQNPAVALSGGEGSWRVNAWLSEVPVSFPGQNHRGRK